MRVIFVLFCFLSYHNIFCQNNIIVDSSFEKMQNSLLKSVYYAPNVLIRDSHRNIIDRKSLIGSNDTICLEICSIGKSVNEALLKCFDDSDRDYIANLILYMLYERNAIDMQSYADVNKIEEWRKYQKDRDFLYWNKLIMGIGG